MELQRLEAAASRLEAAASAPRDWLELANLYASLERLDPTDYRWADRCGHAFWLADRPHEALRPYWRALQLRPEDPDLLRGLGSVQMDLNHFELAERAYRRSLELGGGPCTAWNLSQLLLGLERFEEGYALAEQRWMLPRAQSWRDQAEGGALSKADLLEPLLVWSEQGLGDTIQHLRWLGPLQSFRRSRGEPLLLEVESPLVNLLMSAMPDLGGAVTVRAKPEEQRGQKGWTGKHVALMSLPWLLGGAPLPGGASLLKHSDWPQARSWPVQRPRIGLVWAAGRKLDHPFTAREYWRRSLDPEALKLLLEGLSALGAELWGLQFGSDRDRAEPWAQLLTGWLPEQADFEATAAMVAELDLVISVDTSAAHLVGAMGRRCWLLLPASAAPRWLRDRPDSPWYPSMRLFRQTTAGDWRSVVDRLLSALSSSLGA